MAQAHVKVVLNESAFAALARDSRLRDEMVRVATERVVRPARSRAPRDTGFGAGHIHAEAVFEENRWAVHVGVDQLAYYMMFHQTGTRFLPPDPFLTSTVEGL